MAMRRQKKQKSSDLSLRNKRGNPIAKLRVMQITSTSTVPYLPVSTSSGTTKPTAPAQDSEPPALALTSPTFFALVQEAKSYPEVRSELVAAYKAQVASGHYPAPDVISGLADLFSDTSN
jgi:anti-sigma28 factor (negative regulator of flagellin synthesis)